MIEHIKFEGTRQFYLLYSNKEKNQRSFFVFSDNFNSRNGQLFSGPPYYRESYDTAKTIGPKEFWEWGEV